MPTLMLHAFLMSFFNELCEMSSYASTNSNRSVVFSASPANSKQMKCMSRAAAYRKMMKLAEGGEKLAVWTSQPDFAMHFSSVIAGIEISRLKAVNLSDKHWSKMTELVEKSKQLRIGVVFHSPKSLKPLITSIRGLASTRNPPKFLFIDLFMVSDWLSSQGQKNFFSQVEITEMLKPLEGVEISRIYTFC